MPVKPLAHNDVGPDDVAANCHALAAGVLLFAK
jgi:hypothetical protein